MPIQADIVVSLQVPGVHRWANCPIPEMSFLKDYHRHIFHIKATKEVNHDDRDVEIIMFKKEIIAYLEKCYKAPGIGDNCLFFQDMSCEMIARELIEEFDLTSCLVLEDNENGAFLSVF